MSVETIGGYRLTGHARRTELGTWHRAVGPDGEAAAALRFDMRLLVSVAASERLAAAVTSQRDRALTGLLPVAGLVRDREQVWLFSDRPAVPTVADLLNREAEGLDTGSTATVLFETAHALISLHEAGLAHGAMDPETIVIGADGQALLAETGLADALLAEDADPARDIRAWARLARRLAGTWAAGDEVCRTLFDECAALAENEGLAAARDLLIAEKDLLPRGYQQRAPLAAAAARHNEPVAPVVDLPWDSEPTHTPVLAVADEAGPSTGDLTAYAREPGLFTDRTRLVAPDAPVVEEPQVYADQSPFLGEKAELYAGPQAEPYAGPAEEPTAFAPDAEPYAEDFDESFGSRAPTDVLVRVGPGVPAAAAQIWREGQSTHSHRSRRRGGNAGLIGTGIAVAVLLLILFWWLLSPGLKATAARVEVPQASVGCNGTATIVGVITTNGASGDLKYVWQRSDGTVSKEIVQAVSQDQKSVRVTLSWTVTGQGESAFTATLKVLSPVETPLEGKGTFTYACA